jgi:hypothetical protein
VTLAWIVPDWPAPAGVRAATTLRTGGVSAPPWNTLNLGANAGDDPECVAENRCRAVATLGLPADPVWLRQVHGRRVLDLSGGPLAEECEADAAVTGLAGRVLVVLTADCLPVLFCDAAGSRVGAAHAGWRGLAAGVLEATVTALARPPGELLAWIGPGIGPDAYEVGPEVRAACIAGHPEATAMFRPGERDRWHLDLAGLARAQLEALGVSRVYGGRWCTASDPARFFSHRRDGRSGRMATLVWLDG